MESTPNLSICKIRNSTFFVLFVFDFLTCKGNFYPSIQSFYIASSHISICTRDELSPRELKHPHT